MVKKSETINAAKDECRKLGASFDYQCGKKRFVGIVELNGKHRKLAISKYSSDHKVLLNIRENIRKIVKELQSFN